MCVFQQADEALPKFMDVPTLQYPRHMFSSTLKILTPTTLLLALAAMPLAAAGPVCMVETYQAPPGCVVELKANDGWGICEHVAEVDLCPYVDGAQTLCVYVNADLACPVALPPGACANNDPAAPAGCTLELKAVGGWGVCAHTGSDTCAYFTPAWWLCVYGDGDLACAPTPFG